MIGCYASFNTKILCAVCLSEFLEKKSYAIDVLGNRAITEQSLNHRKCDFLSHEDWKFQFGTNSLHPNVCNEQIYVEGKISALQQVPTLCLRRGSSLYWKFILCQKHYIHTLHVDMLWTKFINSIREQKIYRRFSHPFNHLQDMWSLNALNVESASIQVGGDTQEEQFNSFSLNHNTTSRVLVVKFLHCST